MNFNIYNYFPILKDTYEDWKIIYEAWKMNYEYWKILNE